MHPGPCLDDIVQTSTRRASNAAEFGTSLLALVVSGPWGSVLTELADHHAYWDHRTGDRLHVFFAGVLSNIQDGRPHNAEVARNLTYFDKEIVQLEPPNRPPSRSGGRDRHPGSRGWYWSPRLFNEFRRELEQATDGRWTFSGSSDLVVVNVLGGGGVEGTVDWASTTCIQLDRAYEDGGVRWFGELIERLTTAIERQPSDEFWGLGDIVARDEEQFGGSNGSRAIKYLIRDVVLPGLGGHGISQLLR